MTAVLEGGEWSAARPGRTLPQGKTRYPFYRRLGGSGRAENLVTTEIRSRTVQPVVSHYTDWATRPIHCKSRCWKWPPSTHRHTSFWKNWNIGKSLTSYDILHAISSLVLPQGKSSVLNCTAYLFPQLRSFWWGIRVLQWPKFLPRSLEQGILC